MELKITDNYKIVHEQLCYTVKSTKMTYGRGKNKSSAPRITIHDEGYFSTIQGAIEKVAKLLIEDGTEDFEGNLDEYVARITNILDNAVERMMKGVK